VLKRLARSEATLRAGGRALARYLLLVRRTTRFAADPPDPYAYAEAHEPVILTAWHGRHLLPPLMRRAGHRVAVLVSRSRDGEMNAVAARALGLEVIRGSGGRNPKKWVEKGGVGGFLELMRALEEGVSVALVADVPRGRPGVCGEGLIQLARLSGRPIVPTAATTRRFVELPTYDRARLPLPFGRGGCVFGVPIYVGRDDDPEAARAAVQHALDEVHARADRLALGR